MSTVTATTPDPQALVQQRYCLSSRPLTPARDNGFVRGYCTIENALHWHLDVTFGEDEHYLRQHQVAQNLILVWKMALNLLKQDLTKPST